MITLKSLKSSYRVNFILKQFTKPLLLKETMASGLRLSSSASAIQTIIRCLYAFVDNYILYKNTFNGLNITWN